MPNWKKIALSGSSPEFASLNVDGAIEASKFSGSFSGSYQGDGSSLTGIDVGEVTLKSDTFTSVTSKQVSHTFGTKDVNVTVYDSDDKLIIPASVTTTDTSTVDLTFDTATTGRVVITKGGHIVTGSITITSQSTATDSFTSQTSYTASHTFGTTDVFVQVYDDTDSLIIPQKIKILTTGSIGLDFDTATTGKVIIGKSGHIVSGSAEVSTVAYSNVTSKPALISSSAQIATDISGSFTSTSSSISTRLTTAESELSNTLISSSAQIASDISGSFTSTSSSLASRLSTAESELSNTLISSSAQIASDISGSLSNTAIAALGVGILSGSAQLPSGIVSSSAQTIANLPSGTVSGSAQTVANLSNQDVDCGSLNVVNAITASAFTGTFTGSLAGTASYAVNSVTSSRSVNENTNSGSISFWQGSQAEYNLISGSASNDIIYFVV